MSEGDDRGSSIAQRLIHLKIRTPFQKAQIQNAGKERLPRQQIKKNSEAWKKKERKQKRILGTESASVMHPTQR